MGLVLAAVFVLGLGVGLLAIPLDMSLRYRSETDSRPRVQIVWLFGAVRQELGAGPPMSASKPRTRPPFTRLRELWDEGLGERVGELFRALRRVIELREFSARARLGTGDPAETGMLMGTAQPLRAAFLAAFPPADVQLEPEFADAAVDVEARGTVRIVPLTTLPPVLRFLLSPVTVRTIRVLRSSSS